MNYSVKWNGKSVNVLSAPVYPPCYNEDIPMEFVIISDDKGGVLTVKSDIEIKSAMIRPLSLNMVPEIIDAHTVTVKFNKSEKISLEINGSYENNLVVFASKTFVPDETKFENVIRFAPGRHDIGDYTVNKDNTLIIVEEGAFLNGGLLIKNCENITLCGKGIISKEEYKGEKKHCLCLKNVKNCNVYDVLLSTSQRWTFALFNTIDVHIDNINIIGSTGNNDGIDVCNSKNVLVEHVFTRTWDDSFCVKATGEGTASFSLSDDGDSSCKAGSYTDGNVENLTFRDSTLWNDFARPMEIGVEMRSDYARNISFTNIDVIHSMTGYPIMGIHHGDHAEVSDILIDDIRLEDIHGGQIFDLRITDSVWNQDGEKGNIHDVTIKNIAIVEEQDIIPAHSRIEGDSDKAAIENVTLENFSFCGKTANSIEECQIDIYDYVKNVTYSAPEKAERLNRIASKLEFVKEPAIGADGLYHAVVGITLTNCGKTEEKGDVRLHISPIHTAIYNEEKRFFSLLPSQTFTTQFDVTMQAGKYVVALQSTNPGVEYVFRYIALDALLSDDIKKAADYRFINYYNEEYKGFRFAVKDDELIISSPYNVPFTVYTAMPVPMIKDHVLFTCEETDFGTAPAVTNSERGPVAAPQLRCPAEIWYVFKNQPAVSEIVAFDVENPQGITKIPFEKLHLPSGCKNFWLELKLKTPESKGRRYPFTLFHSVDTFRLAHMFVNVIVK